MTVGHLVFSTGMSIYVLIGIYFEEKSLAKQLGQHYIDYQQRTKRLFPKLY
jgi:protein-S-isoprenylcysteine O-methyltransferase Ste14